MWKSLRPACCHWLAFLSIAATATAGMPSMLPVDLREELVTQLNAEPLLRLQSISFFLLAWVLCTLVLWGLWLILRKDFPQLPRLTLGRAWAMVTLWGLMFVIVLTMISGARELMTPGAWVRSGATYKLREVEDGPPVQKPAIEVNP